MTMRGAWMLGAVVLVAAFAFPARAAGGRVTRDYNGGWSFSFDRRQWRDVRIPHDWAIAGPFCPTNDSATAKLPWQGVGYYRKALEVSRPEKGRRYVLDFDGIMCDGTVFVNGQPCGHQPYGYLGLRADITPYLTETNNVVEVRADTTKLKSRWYPGAGLYRRVRFVETDDVCLDERDVRVLTPKVDARRAEIEIRGQVTSHRTRAVRARVKATVTGGGKSVSSEGEIELAPCDKTGFALKLAVDSPRLWEMTNPAELYAVRVEVSLARAEKNLAHPAKIFTRVVVRVVDHSSTFVIVKRRFGRQAVGQHPHFRRQRHYAREYIFKERLCPEDQVMPSLMQFFGNPAHIGEAFAVGYRRKRLYMLP